MKGIMTKLISLILCTFIIVASIPCVTQADTAAYTDKDFSAYVSQSHPRLYVNSFEGLKEQYLADPVTREWYEALIAQADNLVNNVAAGEGLDYDLLDDESHSKLRRTIDSQEALERFCTLAFAAAVEDSRVYADRLWAEAELAANLSSWNPYHWLEVGEMTHSMAIAYDWCYKFWDDEQKEIFETAIKTKGLDPAVTEYNGVPQCHTWVYGMDGTEMGTNWTVVCNTGVLLGSLAIYEKYPICNTMINNAIRSMKAGLNAWSADGAYYESIMYWNYATRNLIMATDAFESAIGGDFSALPQLESPFLYDFSLAPGVSKTPDFFIYGMGNDGMFDYGDTVQGSIHSSPAMMWIGERFGVDYYTNYHIDALEANGLDGENLALNLLWYSTNGDDAILPTDRLFANDFVSLRSSWDSNGIYAALKGGSNGRSHQHYDIGTFVIDAFGTRFVRTLGASNYSWTDPGENYYLKRPEGSNTIVVNPDEYIGQNATGTSEFEVLHSDSSSSYAILDMTGAYDKKTTVIGNKKNGIAEVSEPTAVTSAKRGIRLFKDRSRIMLQDEITTSQPSEIYWFMHTAAEITIRPGGKTAVLTKNGKSMYLNLVCDKDVSFEKMVASPLETSPNPSDQRSDYDYKLAIHAEDVTELNLAVEMVPVEQAVPSFTSLYTPLSDWHPENDVTIDGRDVTLYGISKNVSTVTMAVKSPKGNLCAIGQKEANADDEYTFDFALPQLYENGTYTVYVNGSVSQTFEMSGSPEAKLSVNEPQFSCDSLQAGTVNVNVSVANTGTLDADATCYVALMRDGELVALDCLSSEIEPDSSTDFKLNIDVPSDYEDCEINVFVWKIDSSTKNSPVTKKYVFDSSGGRYQ